MALAELEPLPLGSRATANPQSSLLQAHYGHSEEAPDPLLVLRRAREARLLAVAAGTPHRELSAVVQDQFPRAVPLTLTISHMPSAVVVEQGATESPEVSLAQHISPETADQVCLRASLALRNSSAVAVAVLLTALGLPQAVGIAR